MLRSIVMYCCNKTHIYTGIVYSDTRESLLNIGAGDTQTLHVNDTTINTTYKPASKEHTIHWDTSLQRDIDLVVHIYIYIYIYIYILYII